MEFGTSPLSSTKLSWARRSSSFAATSASAYGKDTLVCKQCGGTEWERSKKEQHQHPVVAGLLKLQDAWHTVAFHQRKEVIKSLEEEYDRNCFFEEYDRMRKKKAGPTPEEW